MRSLVEFNIYDSYMKRHHEKSVEKLAEIIREKLSINKDRDYENI